MANDVATPSNPPVVIVDKDKLEEATLDGTPLDEGVLEVNVSQRSREEEPSKRVVRTRVDCSVWDRRLSPNPHALAIYLEFVLAHGAAQKGLKSVNAKTMMSVSIVERGFPVMAIIVGYEGRSTPFPWSTEPSTLFVPFIAF
jgi:hypothetical protein